MRYAVYFLLTVLLVACNTSPPDGINAETEPLPWQYPDTVSVYVMGQEVGDQVVWDDPGEVEQTWLDKHDYARVRLEVSESGTQTAQDRDLGRFGMDAMAKVYYSRVD